MAVMREQIDRLMTTDLAGRGIAALHAAATAAGGQPLAWAAAERLAAIAPGSVVLVTTGMATRPVRPCSPGRSAKGWTRSRCWSPRSRC